MRIVFVGNVADYSPPYLEALGRFCQGQGGRVSLAAVVCPAARSGRLDGLGFAAKRGVGDVLDRLALLPLPATLRRRLTGAGSGIYREMQRLARRFGAPAWFPPSPSDEGVCDRVAGLGADLAIVAGLNRIVRERTLASFPPLYNVHPSMLPEYRGAVPEFWQLDAGLKKSGVTVHRIDRGVDTGPIVRQREFAIEPWFDAAAFIERSIEVGTSLLQDLLLDPGAWAVGTTPQGDGSYQPIPGAPERIVPFERSSRGVYDRARAVGFSEPLVLHVDASEWGRGVESLAREAAEGTVMLSLFEPVAHLEPRQGVPGLVSSNASGGCLVQCSTGAVEFRRVVPAPAAASTGGG